MSIYDRVRGGKPINPAVALYNHWHALLTGMASCKRDSDNRLQGRSGYGRGWYDVSFYHAYGVAPDTSARPPINYGGLFLHSNGTFKLGQYHGWKQRDVIARHTFLRWGYVHGEYVWWVDTTDEEGGYNRRSLQDWHNPVPYVAEWVAGGKSWRQTGPLLKLAWDNGEWTLAFAKAAEASPHQVPISQEGWDWYIRLREKRYRRYEREHLRATGALPQPRARRTYTKDEIEQRRDAAVQVIVAHMNVTTAARTTPLRRTTEEVGLWEPSGCP